MRYSPGFLTLVAATALSGCGGDAEDERATPIASPARPTLSVAEAPLSRADLLLAVVRAGSAAASGANDDAEQRTLDGKRFALRIRFGCAERTDGARTLRIDAANRRVFLSVAPELDLESPQFADLTPAGFEAAEGFWIRQPWLLDPACPRAATPPVAEVADATARPSPSATAAAPAASTPAPRAGIARFYTESDARTHRRERRAYETRENLLEGEGPSRAGYDLIVEGRLQALPDGRVIACAPQLADAPVCLISASFTQVSLERADNGKLIAEWPSG